MSNIMIAMSGGVDSSVAAYLCNQNENKSIGVTMRLLQEGKFGYSAGCCTEQNIQDAKNVCDAIGIEHYVVDYTENFDEKVVQNFINDYQNGRTPNPCVLCNQKIKFHQLFLEAQKQNYPFLATGHYARISKVGDRFFLQKGVDPSKDQSYVLYTLTQSQLSSIQFPLGCYSKDEIRKIAEEAKLPTAKKKDSQDICFIPDKDYVSFIEKYTGKSFPEGYFLDKDQKILGKHKGIIRYTIGQHKGLGLPTKDPYYVTKIDAETNTVYLGSNDDLFSSEAIIHKITLSAIDKMEKPMKLKAKIRYKHEEADVIAEQLDDDCIRVVFQTPQRAITKGQSLVLYDGDIVIGGGIID